MQALSKYAPYALAVLRIVTAVLFIEHGTAKLLGFFRPCRGQTRLEAAFRP